MKHLVVIALVLAIVRPAAAEPRKVLVMQSDGRADAKLRVKIDATILRLAKATGDQVSAGDITFVDAAAAMGCKPEDATCKDEVIGMLSVDELVLTTVTPKPGGLEIAVRRVGKGTASRETTSLVATDKLDTLDAIAPLFSAKAGTPPVTAPPGPSPPLVGPRPPPVTTPMPPPVAPAPGTTLPGPAGPQLPPSMTTTPTPTEPPVAVIPPPVAVTEPAPPVITTPPQRRDDGPPSRRLQKVGMVGGAAMLTIGLVLWGSALGVQREIDDAPTGTKAELRELQDLEAKGDGYAAAGNVLVLGGLVLGGVSTYYFIKKGRTRRSSTARILPTVLDHGAGIVLSFGGSP